jgi:hypothetical protein
VLPNLDLNTHKWPGTNLAAEENAGFLIKKFVAISHWGLPCWLWPSNFLSGASFGVIVFIILLYFILPKEPTRLTSIFFLNKLYKNEEKREKG